MDRKIVLPEFKGLNHGVSYAADPERHFHVPTTLVRCGYSLENDERYDWDGRRRPPGETGLFQYTLSGGGVFETAKQKRVVGPGDAMILHFPGEHRYRLVESEHDHWEFLFISFCGDGGIRLWREIVDSCDGFVSLPPNCPTVSKAAHIVKAALTTGIPSIYHRAALLYDFKMTLAERIDSPGSPAFEPTIAKAVSYINQRYREHIEIEAIASHVGLSRFHFSRKFKSAFGTTPGNYITTLRIREAARQLKNTRLPIKRISYECGFYDATHFARTFRSHTGHLPSDFRAKGLSYSHLAKPN